MDKQRAKEILLKYKENSDLFNWCDEYNQFVQDNVYCLMNEEAEYILKKSWEDDEAPLKYEDIDLNDYEGLKENILYTIKNDYKEKEEQEDLREEINLVQIYGTNYLDIEEKESFEDFINKLDDNEISQLGQEVFQMEAEQREIFQWFIVSEILAKDIEEEGGIILNSNWFGRESFGQSLTLDYMFIKIYLKHLKWWFDEEELKELEK